MKTYRMLLRRQRQAGLTILELLVSLTIGFMVLFALLYAYSATRSAYRVNENLARMQETGRFALDRIRDDLMQAGFVGCRTRLLRPNEVQQVARPALTGILGQTAFRGPVDGVYGYENGLDPRTGVAWTPPTGLTRLRGDVITIRGAAAGVELSAAADVANASVTLRNNSAGFRQGDYVALANCSRLAIFRVSNEPLTTGNNIVLQHGATITGTGFTAADGNGNNGLVSGTDSHKLTAGSFDLASRPEAYRMFEVTYFIANNPAGRPALYRVETGRAAEEVADNIEDLDVVWGLDFTRDGSAELWSRLQDWTYSNPVDAWKNVFWTQQENMWDAFAGVRVSLLVASPETGVAANPPEVALRDTLPRTNFDLSRSRYDLVNFETSPDTRLRQVFATTVRFRNRGGL